MDHAATKHSDMKSIIVKILKVVLPLGVSVWMVLWLLSKVDVHQIGEIITRECNFRWIALMMLISIFSHVFRGIRWGIQLRAAGLRRQPVMVESVSIFGAYALNLLFPYLGETWRCIFMAREENAKISTVVGTDLGDRFSDALSILVLSGIALWVAHDKMVDFIDHYQFGRRIMTLLDSGIFWGISGGSVMLIAIVAVLCRKCRFMEGTVRVVKELWRSFAVMFHMKGTGAYILLTIAIWGCYFVETYVCFFAFPFTAALVNEPGTAWGLIPGLVAFVFSSFSIAIPSNGGLGPWNVAIMFSLSLYGISETDGAAFSMVVWGFKSGMLIALGLFSALYMMMRRRHSDENGVAVAGNSTVRKSE